MPNSIKKKVTKPKPNIQRKKRGKTIEPKSDVESDSHLSLPFQARPQLLLQSLYFINDNVPKHIAVGYSPENDFRPGFILGNNISHVVLGVVDWLALFLVKQQIEEWFAGVTDDTEPFLLATKNIRVSKYNASPNIIVVENTPRTWSNNQVLLNLREYQKCLELDNLFQPIIKQMQSNAAQIDDYYSLYIFYCMQKRKQTLSDEDYFLPFTTNSSIDTFKLFKEIPLLCSEKLRNDIQFPPMTIC